jgi:hypothetical protein
VAQIDVVWAKLEANKQHSFAAGLSSQNLITHTTSTVISEYMAVLKVLKMKALQHWHAVV